MSSSERKRDGHARQALIMVAVFLAMVIPGLAARADGFIVVEDPPGRCPGTSGLRRWR